MSRIFGRDWLVDASVALKWFPSPAVVPDAETARELIGAVPLKATSLASFEVGSALARTPEASPALVDESLQTMLRNCGPSVNSIRRTSDRARVSRRST